MVEVDACVQAWEMGKAVLSCGYVVEGCENEEVGGGKKVAALGLRTGVVGMKKN